MYAQILKHHFRTDQGGPVTEPLLETVELATEGRTELAVIWLHGLGADGHDFEPIVPELGVPFGVRFVFPHAPIRAVTINNGMRMRAWYDILGFRGVARGRSRYPCERGRCHAARGPRGRSRRSTEPDRHRRVLARRGRRAAPRIALDAAACGRASAIDLSAARRLAGPGKIRRERGLADLHGARQRRSGDSARARRGVAAPARGRKDLRSIGTSTRCSMRSVVPRCRRSAVGSPRSRGAEWRRGARSRQTAESSGNVSRTSPEMRPAASNDRSANVTARSRSTSTTVDDRVP